VLTVLTAADSPADSVALTLATDVAFDVKLTSRDGVPALQQLTSG